MLRLRVDAALLFAAVVLLGCGVPSTSDPGEVLHDPGVELVLDLFGDTIDAHGVLSVVVVSADGRRRVAFVELAVIWTDSTSTGAPATLERSSIVTDSEGRLQMDITAGRRPGAGAVVAEVTSLSLSDTVAFQVAAGAVHRIATSLRPALFVDSVYPFSVVALDRRDNPLPGVRPTLLVTTGNIEVDTAAMTVRAPDAGRVATGWGGDGALTKIHALVVPRGSITYSEWVNGSFGGRSLVLRVANLDGSNVRDVDSQVMGNSDARGLLPTWSLDGERLAYGDTGAIFINDLNGSRSAVATGVLPTSRLSRTADRRWVYFTQDDVETWRARTDGSLSERVVVGMGRVSPDGRFVAIHDSDGLSLYNIASRTKTWFSEAGMPSWSPDGTFILAPNSSGAGSRLEVYRINGTIEHTIPPPPGSNGPIHRASFSPDGEFAVVEAGTAFSGTRLWMVRIDTGAWFELSYLPRDLAEPDWRAELVR